LSNLYEHARPLRSSANDRGARLRVPARVFGGDFASGRRPGFAEIASVDARRWKRILVLGKRQFRLPGSQRDKGRQRVRVGGFASSRERCCKSSSSPHVGELADRPEAGQRAVHARGRWRLDDRKVVRRPPRTKAAEMPWRYEEDLDAQVLAGLPTALGTGSPKGMFSRVHVMRSVGCRSWFEASWRGVRAEPRGETRRNVERV
jgi:hypothetical protein